MDTGTIYIERTPAEAQAISQRLISNYSKEAELYSSILKLTELQQANLEQDGNISDFVMLLEQKEELIRAIDKIELQVTEDKEAWLHVPEIKKVNCSDGLNALLDRIIMLIECIMNIERENEELLRIRKDEVENQLHSLRKSRKAARAYQTETSAQYISAIR